MNRTVLVLLFSLVVTTSHVWSEKPSGDSKGTDEHGEHTDGYNEDPNEHAHLFKGKWGKEQDEQLKEREEQIEKLKEEHRRKFEETHRFAIKHLMVTKNITEEQAERILNGLEDMPPDASKEEL